jgi:iron-sulfur cluster insertion protein
MKITAAASIKINQFLAKEPQSSVFRVSVDTGGCSGFKYKTEMGPGHDDDLVLEPRVVMDAISGSLLTSVVLDYIDSIGQSGFVFNNPSATSTCGCGTSFDV